MNTSDNTAVYADNKINDVLTDFTARMGSERSAYMHVLGGIWWNAERKLFGKIASRLAGL
jgi:hypothetical protein